MEQSRNTTVKADVSPGCSLRCGTSVQIIFLTFCELFAFQYCISWKIMLFLMPIIIVRTSCYIKLATNLHIMSLCMQT